MAGGNALSEKVLKESNDITASRTKGLCPLSVVIIAHNEERNIARCIESVQSLADEVILLDSGSTDNTVAISKSLGAKVHHHPFDDYADQKNRAAALAQNELVLSLDADEALSESLKQSLEQVLKGEGPILACSMNRLTNYCGTWVKNGGWYPDTKLRIYPKSRGRWKGVFVHEELEVDTDIPRKQLRGDLLHYSFYSIGQHMQTVNNFSERKARKDFQKGKRFSYLKLIFAAPVKFISIYLLRMAWRDGWAGYHIARISAFGAYLHQAKLGELERQKKRRPDKV